MAQEMTSGAIDNSAAPEKSGQVNPWDSLEVLESNDPGQDRKAEVPEKKTEEGVKPEEAKQEITAPAKTESEPPADERPNAQKRISELNARAKRAEEQRSKERQSTRSEIAELRKQIDELRKANQPKLKRENFLSDEEYHKHVVKQELERERAEAEEKRRGEDEAREQQTALERESAERWQESVSSDLKPEEAVELDREIRAAERQGVRFRQEIIDYVSNADVGPSMLLALLKGKDDPRVQNLARLPREMVFLKLNEFERAIRSMKTGQQNAQAAHVAKQASAAPAPVGSVGAAKGAANPSLSDADWNAAEIKKRTRR